jgi:PAS domain S-box-containing protein
MASGCVVVGVALAVLGLVDVGGQTAKRAATDAGFVVFSVFAALACFRAARLRAPGRRLPWWLLGAAAACYAVGNTIWFYYQVLAPEKQSYPGPADVFFVAVVPFAIAAMLVLPSQALSSAARARAIADGLIVGTALLFISWILVVGPLLDQLGETSWIHLAVYLYYPLTDIVIISVASGLAVRAAGRERLPMLLVAAGFVAIACADTGIGYLALQGKEAAGSGLDLGWTFGYMLLGLAALTPVWRETSEDRADPRALVRELLPYVPVGVVLVLVAIAPSRLTDGVLVGLLVVIVALLVVRHMLTLADNIRLTGDLEDRVRGRTHELEQLTRRHTSILDGAGEGIVGLDQSARLTFANPSAAALLGRSPDELVGRSFHQVTDPRDADGEPIPADLDPIAEALADGRFRAVTDETYRRADGTDFSVELTVAPMRDADDVTGAVLMFRDVTERRAVDRLKDEFVSVVSHELRTPLTSLRGALGLLHGGLLQEAPPKAQRMVHIAVESTDRLIRLINDILDVERITSGKFALHRQAWPAANLVGRAVAEMRGLAAEAEVHLEIGTVAGDVDADADRIVQTIAKQIPAAVLMDLTLPGVDGWKVIAGLRDDERIRDVPVLIVSGTGPGVGPAPVGVAAWLTKPLDVAGLLAALEDAIAVGEPRPCVLVVEEDPTLTQVLAALFAEHGVMVVQAHTARDALRLSRDIAPDLLLLDLLLPDNDGFALVDWLREDPRLCRVPLVVYSALELDEDDKERLRLGPTEFFTKARTNPEEVERQVLELLDVVVTGATR